MANNPNNVSIVSVNSAPIVNLVKQACEDEVTFQETFPQILDHVRANKQSAPKAIVDTVKSLIKDRKVDSPSKVIALKILHLCTMDEGGNEEFIVYIEKKLLNRLTVLAKYKKDSNDIEKGATLFGKGPNVRASADFMKLLLLNIQQWATRFPQVNGRQSEIFKIYQQLLTKEKIYFPTEQAVMESLCPNYQANSNMNTQNSNATSTAPQSLNHSDFISGNGSAFGTNISMMTDQFSSTPNTQSLPQVVRQSLNHQIASKLVSNTATGGQPQQSKEEQAQLAQRIRSDYKKLSEYQSTANLVKEVIGTIKNPKEVDSELLGQFKEQLLEGKQFTEGFLKIIMEVPIKDRDAKIEKVLGIIAEIEEQLKKIQKLMPHHEETKRGENLMSKSTNDASANMTSKDSNKLQQVSQTVEIKGILKKENNRFASNNTDFPAQSARNAAVENMPLFEDFKFDQNAFKTNFAQSINPKMMNSNGGASGNWFSQEQPLPQKQEESSIFDMFSQKKVEDPFSSQPQILQPQIQKGFDFGFDDFKPQVNQSVIVESKQPFGCSTTQINFDNWGFGGHDEVNQSQILPPSKPLALADNKRKGSNDSSLQRKSFKSAKSFRSNNGEPYTGRASDQFGVIKNVSQHQPQITQRSPDSNPLSDQDEAKISDNDDSHQVEFKIPQAMKDINQSLMKLQQVTTQKRDFEKFDFSEVQAFPSQRSGLSREDPLLAQRIEQLESQLKTSQENEVSQKLQLKKLEHTLSEMTQDIIRLKKCEARLDDAEMVSMQVEQQMRIVQKEADEYKKQAEKMESKVHKAIREHENAMIEVLELRKDKQRLEQDLASQKTSHDAINLQLQKDLNNARQNEEQLKNQLAESKKREEYMKDQWLQDLKKHQTQVDDWQDRELDLQNQISERDEEIAKVKAIVEGLKKELAEAQNQLQSQQVTVVPQQKLVIKSSQIKLTSSFVNSKHGSPKQPSNQSSQVKSSLHNQTLSETKFDFKPQTEVPNVVETPSFEPISSSDIQLREPQFSIQKFEEEVKVEEEIVQIALNESPVSQKSNKNSDELLTAVKVDPEPGNFFTDVEARIYEQPRESPKAQPFDFSFPMPEEIKVDVNFFDSLPDHQPNSSPHQSPKQDSFKSLSPKQSHISPKIIQSPVKIDEPATLIINSTESEDFQKINASSPQQRPSFSPASLSRKDSSPIQDQIIIIPPVSEHIIEHEQPQIDESKVIVEERKSVEKAALLFQEVKQGNAIAEDIKNQQVVHQMDCIPEIKAQPVIKKVTEDVQVPQRKYSDPFEEATVLMQSPQQIVKKQINNFQPPNPLPNFTTNMNQSFDKSAFNTINTENFHKTQVAESPINAIMNGFFRKALMTNKTVLYEDPNVQIGLVVDNSNIQLIRMRLFFGNKSGPTVQHLSFKFINPSPAFQINQSRTEILNLSQGQQEPVDINFAILSYQISVPPIFNMSYNGQSFFIKLPLFTLKFCSHVPQLDNPAAYVKSWQQLEKGETKVIFNLDFNACRSLTQLKETLKIGRNAMNFPEGVETAKNIVSGVTMLQIPNQSMLVCLVKISMTVDGRNCEIVGRSNDITPMHGQVEDHGKFAKVIIGNVLEMIALRK